MSIQFAVTCLDCKRLAPPLGDGGFLGVPSLAPVADVDWRGDPMPSFGYLYEALAGLGIRTYDLEAFGEFLKAHDGHRIVLSNDHDDSSDLPPELLAIEEAPEFDGQVWSDMQAQDAERERRANSGEFSNAIYTLTCLTCGKAHQAADAELLRSFGPFTISADAVSMYVERWAGARDDGWNHRLMGIIDPYEPFLKDLGRFLEKHRQHPLQAQLSAATTLSDR